MAADRAAEWTEKVTKHFGFVSDFGFTLHSADASSWWEVRVTFRSQSTALAVIQSNEFARVEVQLMRLVDGQLPTYPIFVVDSVPANTFYLDDLLKARMPGARRALRKQHGLKDSQVEAQLRFWSSALQTYGTDFLTGDTRVLDQLESVVRERAKKTPQRVEVWLPRGASAEEERAAQQSAENDVPEEVEVRTRRYRRPWGGS